MDKIDVGYANFFSQTCAALAGDGVLIVTQGPAGRPNIMTIGWGSIGVIWGKPIFTILVRPSRYTYELLEQRGEFTVNVPTPALRKATVVCGSQSGRNTDKFAACELSPLASLIVAPPLIRECAIHYECRVVHRNNVIPNALADQIVTGYYARGDFHRVYFGEIVRSCIDPERIAELKP
jgi:flavin reductase (DIM6/NTAB) family NADH-FMN oxidoreductase RutF